MRVRELFKPTSVSQSIGGLTIFLDRDNCHVANITKDKNSVMLHLKRELDGAEGQAHLRAKDKFETISTTLLKWAFVSNRIIGLTLNQLDELETNLNVEEVQGRIQLKEGGV